MPKLILVRGLPGSGKTTYAEGLSFECVHYEADMFFTNYRGAYTFNSKFLAEAHDWCYSSVAHSLMFGSDVVVTNTFTQLWEMERYIDLRNKIKDLQIDIIEMKHDYGSVHDVPMETYVEMKKRWADIPDEWIWRYDLTVKEV